MKGHAALLVFFVSLWSNSWPSKKPPRHQGHKAVGFFRIVADSGSNLLVSKRVSQGAPLLVFFVSLWFMSMAPTCPSAAFVADV
jgi:hypothetical protein